MNTKYILVITLVILSGVFYFGFSSKDLGIQFDTINQFQENIIKDPEILLSTTTESQESILIESDIDMNFEGNEYRNPYPSFSVKIPSSFQQSEINNRTIYFNEYTENEEEGFKKDEDGKWIKAQIIIEIEAVKDSDLLEAKEVIADMRNADVGDPIKLTASSIGKKIKDIDLDGCLTAWISFVSSPFELATTRCLHQDRIYINSFSINLFSKEEVFSDYIARYEAMLGTFYFSDFIFEDLTEQEQQFSRYILREGEISLAFRIEDYLAWQNPIWPKNPGLIDNEIYKDFFVEADPQNIKQIFLSIYGRDEPPRSPHRLGIAVIQYESEEKLNLDAIKIKDRGLRGKDDAIFLKDSNILVLVYSDWNYYPKEIRYVADGLKTRLNLQEI